MPTAAAGPEIPLKSFPNVDSAAPLTATAAPAALAAPPPPKLKTDLKASAIALKGEEASLNIMSETFFVRPVTDLKTNPKPEPRDDNAPVTKRSELAIRDLVPLIVLPSTETLERNPTIPSVEIVPNNPFNASLIPPKVFDILFSTFLIGDAIDSATLLSISVSLPTLICCWVNVLSFCSSSRNLILSATLSF